MPLWPETGDRNRLGPGFGRQGSNTAACDYIELEIPPDRGARLADAVIGPKIDLLVFDRAPEPLDEHVVPPRTLAVHADLDAVFEQQAGEVLAGELGTLVGVENLRCPVPDKRFLDRFPAE